MNCCPTLKCVELEESSSPVNNTNYSDRFLHAGSLTHSTEMRTLTNQHSAGEERERGESGGTVAKGLETHLYSRTHKHTGTSSQGK